MGTDVAGWVEVNIGPEEGEEGLWLAVVNIGLVLDRCYDLFGCLFGVRNYARFKPLFANRGLPPGSSAAAKLFPGTEAAHDATWFTFAELTRIDPNEMAEAPDERIHEFVVQPDGSEKFAIKAAWSAVVEPHREAVFRHGSVRLPDRVLRAVILRRGDVLEDANWPVAVKLMSVLADRYGGEHVRAVVWFDD